MAIPMAMALVMANITYIPKGGGGGGGGGCVCDPYHKCLCLRWPLIYHKIHHVSLSPWCSNLQVWIRQTQRSKIKTLLPGIRHVLPIYAFFVLTQSCTQVAQIRTLQRKRLYFWPEVPGGPDALFVLNLSHRPRCKHRK